jgi:glutathione S-transferase
MEGCDAATGDRQQELLVVVDAALGAAAQIGIPFDEIKLRFDFNEGSAYRQEVARYSPAGLVPLLVHDGFVVWDTLAIAEYLHDALPTAGIWPADRQQRARARCLAPRCTPALAPCAATAR